MNIKNSVCFIKDLSAHVSNINRALKNIKSEIVADFIHSDYHKMNYSLICDIWILGALSEV